MGDSPRVGGSSVVYAVFVDDEYRRQTERRDRIAARGQQLITHTGAFLTAMIALVTLVADRPADIVAAPASVFFFAALLAAVAAITIGIYASGNRTYHAADPKTLRQMTSRFQWEDSEEQARYCVCVEKRKVANKNHYLNNKLAGWALAGQYGQIVMIVAFALGYALFLRTLP